MLRWSLRLSFLILIASFGACAGGREARYSPDPGGTHERAPAAPLADGCAIEKVDVRLESAGMDVSDVAFHVHVRNGSSAPRTLKGIAHRMSSGGRLLHEGRSARADAIPQGGLVSVRHVATLPMIQVMGALEGTQPGTVVPFEAEIWALESEGRGTSTVVRGEVPFPAGLRVVAVTTGGDGRLVLEIENPNAFGVFADSIVVRLVAGGSTHDLQRLDLGEEIPPRATARVALDGGPAAVPAGDLLVSGSAMAYTAYGQMNLPIDGRLAAGPPR